MAAFNPYEHRLPADLAAKFAALNYGRVDARGMFVPHECFNDFCNAFYVEYYRHLNGDIDLVEHLEHVRAIGEEEDFMGEIIDSVVLGAWRESGDCDFRSEPICGGRPRFFVDGKLVPGDGRESGVPSFVLDMGVGYQGDDDAGGEYVDDEADQWVFVPPMGPVPYPTAAMAKWRARQSPASAPVNSSMGRSVRPVDDCWVGGVSPQSFISSYLDMAPVKAPVTDPAAVKQAAARADKRSRQRQARKAQRRSA